MRRASGRRRWRRKMQGVGSAVEGSGAQPGWRARGVYVSESAGTRGGRKVSGRTPRGERAMRRMIGGESRRGASLVELALILPLLFLLIVNAVNFGAFLHAVITVANA